MTHTAPTQPSVFITDSGSSSSTDITTIVIYVSAVMAVGIIAIVMLFIVKKNHTANEIQMVTNDRGFTIDRLKGDHSGVDMEIDNPVYEEPQSIFCRAPELPPPRRMIEVIDDPPIYDIATTTDVDITNSTIDFDSNGETAS